MPGGVVRAVVGLAAAVLVLAAVAGCGIPTERAARRVSSSEVPFGLVDPTTTTDAPTTTAVLTATAPVFLLREQRIVPVERTVAAPVNAAKLLRELLTGPTEGEAAAGFRTAISNGTRLLHTTVSGSVATLDLSSEFVQVTGEEQILAIAQLVYTATAAPEVAAVRITLAGSPVEVPREDGTLTMDPLRRSDYPSLSPA